MILSSLSWAFILTMLGSLSTGFGGILVVIQESPDRKTMGFLQACSAGVMLFLSFVDLLADSVKTIGLPVASTSFFFGVVFVASIILFVPDPDWEHWSQVTTDKVNRKLLMTGVITAIGLALHNFPEGIAVYLGTLKGLRFGIPLAMAISLHNLPEGMAVAMPIYFATRNRWTSVKLAFFSGFFEPLGVLVVASIFGSNISEHWVQASMAAVAGVMTFIALYELLPLALEYCGRDMSTIALFTGMAITALTLAFLKYYEEHSRFSAVVT